MPRLGVEAVLGLSRSAGSLSLDPCIPRQWPTFEAWVCVGPSETLHVVVDNPDGVSRGVRSVTMDGASLDSNRIPLAVGSASAGESRVREVRVELGGSPRVERASVGVDAKDKPLEKAG